MASPSPLPESGRQTEPPLEPPHVGRPTMRTSRLLGAFAAAACAAITPLSASVASSADPNGVGRCTVGATLLQVDGGPAGNVLSVKVLSDEGRSTIDPTDGSPVSSSSLTPFSISSGVVPALNLS